ncbi:MAG TPA: PAS domain S-box protein [Steroidobacteraceae bacterium]|nr:PAS domain S-box protein [Steroidobacteraceae bacterium]
MSNLPSPRRIAIERLQASAGRSEDPGATSTYVPSPAPLSDTTVVADPAAPISPADILTTVLTPAEEDVDTSVLEPSVLAPGPASRPGSLATTVIRDEAEGSGTAIESLHPKLLTQLREARLKSASGTPELGPLLELVSAHYRKIDAERRGTVRSMQLMAEEAGAIVHKAEARSDEQLRTVLEQSRETMLALDAQGCVQLFNSAGERIFGYERREVLGRSLELLVPQISDGGNVAQALELLLTQPTPAARVRREIWGRRKSGKLFPLELCVGRAQLAGAPTFVVCLSDISERHAAGLALHESDARAGVLAEVLHRLAARAPLPELADSLTRLIESRGIGRACTVSVLGADGASFSSIIGPNLPEPLRAALQHARIGIRDGSCAAAVYLRRTVVVADAGKDPFAQHLRARLLEAGLHSSWSTPIKFGNGQVRGALGVYRGEIGLPGKQDTQLLLDAARLAAIALEEAH